MHRRTATKRKNIRNDHKYYSVLMSGQQLVSENMQGKLAACRWFWWFRWFSGSVDFIVNALRFCPGGCRLSAKRS